MYLNLIFFLTTKRGNSYGDRVYGDLRCLIRTQTKRRGLGLDIRLLFWGHIASVMSDVVVAVSEMTTWHVGSSFGLGHFHFQMEINHNIWLYESMSNLIEIIYTQSATNVILLHNLFAWVILDYYWNHGTEEKWFDYSKSYKFIYLQAHAL
jgi:hypothetical protein